MESIKVVSEELGELTLVIGDDGDHITLYNDDNELIGSLIDESEDREYSDDDEIEIEDIDDEDEDSSDGEKVDEDCEDGECTTEKSEAKAKIKKIVNSEGKVVKKLTCAPGFKLVDGKCVKMSATEIKTRSLAAKKSAKKRTKASYAKASKLRNKTMKKRAKLIKSESTSPLTSLKQSLSRL